MGPATPRAARLGIVSLNVAPPEAGWRSLPARFAAFEAAGAESIWVTDHLFWHAPAPDALSTLALLAMATEHATVGTSVLQLPLHEPASVAKSIAMTEALAPGRVVLGVGVGEHPGEYSAAGRGDHYRRRGEALDQGIDQVRRSWAASGAYRIAPGGPVPVWVGGRSDAARRRAARVGDGWTPHLCSADWFAAQQPLLDADLQAVGRPVDAIVRAVVVAVSVTSLAGPDDGATWLGRLYGLDPDVARRAIVAGSAAQIAATLGRYVAAGATEILLVVTSDEPVAQLQAVRAAFSDGTPPTPVAS